MKRFDLRDLHDDFYGRMKELIDEELAIGEVGIFLFEVDDFSHVARSAEFIKHLGYEIMNSVRFNHRDWTLVMRKNITPNSQQDSTNSLDSSAQASIDASVNPLASSTDSSAQDANPTHLRTSTANAQEATKRGHHG